MSKAPSKMHLRIFDGRVADEPEWDVPLTAPLHHWAVPIGVMAEGTMRAVGTAFHFSQLGHLLTARHCVDEALHPISRGLPLVGHTRNVRMHHQLVVKRVTQDDPPRIIGFPVLTVSSTDPTDLAILTTLFQENIPQLTLPISFAFPDAGSTVRCFGFPQGPDSEELMPRHLHAVEGTVKAYFPPGFAEGFMKGPCFLVSASVPHGMSGGPVVNEAGAVCGVVSAGAELFMEEPGYLATPLYPAILTPIALRAQLGASVRIDATRTLVDLCADGFIHTDGTEDRVHFREDVDGIEIGPVISALNGDHVFNSFEDYLQGRRSTPVSEARMRIRMTRSGNTPPAGIPAV